ncbi:MAG: N-formylglutamate amidohydrolase [Asticcacaulis sp.]
MADSAPTPWHTIHSEDKAFAVVRPRAPSGLVYSLPHSGRYYPDSFVHSARLQGSALRASEDAWVDEMVPFTPDAGVYGIACRYARAFCDVNRNALELDARLIRGDLPKAALGLSARVKAGYGVIARCLSANQDIYSQPLDMAEVNRRLDLIHRPYHDILRGLVSQARADAGRAILIDWHSMPSSALLHSGGVKPDIVLGTLHGESCSDGLVRRVKAAFEAHGLRVGLNKPFAGGYIVEHYGRPGDGVEAMQIEINRALYMDEATLKPNDGMARLQRVFAGLTEKLTAMPGVD